MLSNSALILELENQIPQVDIMGANVDETIQEWAGKPDKQTPLHVRLMLWLKDNANKFGYEQSGDGWKLKG